MAVKTLQKILKDFDSSWTYTSGSWHQRWLDNYALYHNNRVKVGYTGITDTFVPMTFSTVETMNAALFGNKPKFNYLSPSTKPDQETEILNALVDYYWDKDNWTIKMIACGRSMLQLGTSVLYMYWDNDHPCIVNIPIRDFFIDPTATHLNNARYMGRRYLTTREELESFEIIDLDNPITDPITGETTYAMKKKYNNLGKIKNKNTSGVVGKAAVGGQLTDKEEKDLSYGSTLDANANQVEVIEWWTEDNCVSVANRAVIIEDTENWYKTKGKYNGNEYSKGVFPFAAFRDYIDESLFYAKGEIDFIADEQELLNDITNQNIDSVTYALNQMTRIDPSRADLVNEYENVPGAVYVAKAGEIEPIRMGTVPPEAFMERQNIKNEIRETTASNEVIKGVGQQGGKVTATEIQAQVAGAGQRVSLKVSQIENEGYHQLAKLLFKMIQLYVTEPTLVRIVGKNGIRWEEFDPEEFYGEYEPRVQLDITVQNQKKEDAAIAKEMLAAFVNDPNINQHELSKLVLSRSFGLEPDEVDLLVAPQQQPGMPPEMGGVPGQPPQPGQQPMPPQGMPDQSAVPPGLGV